MRQRNALLIISFLYLGLFYYGGTNFAMPLEDEVNNEIMDMLSPKPVQSKAISLDVSEQMWNQSFGGTGEDDIYAISNCSDGGYVMVGCTSSFGGSNDVWLTKTDQYGNWNWHRTFGGSSLEQGVDVIECSDGGYAIVGTQTITNEDVLLIKTNSFGIQTWNKTFGGIHEDGGTSILELSGGGFLISSYYSPASESPVDLLIWTDSSGNLVDSLTYTSTNAIAAKVISCSDGGYLMVGTNDIFTVPKVWAVKIDDAGKEVWSYTYDSGQAVDVVESTSGGYAIIGSDFGDTLIVQISSSGTKIRSVTYDLGNADVGNCISNHPLGGFVIVGTTDFYTPSNEQGFVLRIGNTGIVRWNTTITGFNGTATGLYVSDDNSIIVSTTIDMGNPSLQNGWLLSMPSFYFTQVCEDVTLERDLGYRFDSNTSADMVISQWWINGSVLEVDENGIVTDSSILPMGETGFYISVNDTLGRTLTELFYIYVEDNMAPRWIVGPENQTHEYGTVFMYDLEAYDASGVTYWINDTVHFEHISDGYIESNGVLPLGVYPLRMNVTDGFDHILSTEFTVSITDTTVPSLNHPVDMIKEYTTTDSWLQWTCSDLLPDYFIVSRNGIEIESGAWNGTNLKVKLDGLDLGVYSFHIWINDTSGNFAEDEVIVYIADLIDPMMNHPDDMWFIEGSKGHSILWIPEDLFPTSYTIFVDGVDVESGPWDGSSISYAVDDLSPGIHNCTLVVVDINSNSISDYVQVVVIEWPEGTTTTTTLPTTSTTIETTTTTTMLPTTSTTTTETTAQPTTNLYNIIRGVESGLTFGIIIVGVLAGLAIIVGLINIRMMRKAG